MRDPQHGTPILLVIGTRPEAIKMLPVIRAFRESTRVRPIIISTGQHPQLVEEVLAFAELAPDVTLTVRDDERTLNGLFAAVMRGFQEYVSGTFGENPGPGVGPGFDGFPVATLVHGDTSSAAAAALASFHLRIPVAHVEAGLRTSDTLSPFPEELNRQLISRIAAAHFAPTPRNAANLMREGVDLGKILVTGNTAIDALTFAAEHSTTYGAPELADLEGDDDTRVIVVTAHRRENWGRGIARIADAVAELAARYPRDRFVVSLHPNPAVADVLRRRLEHIANVTLVQPLRYASFARLLGRAHIAITDSGGIQEEAPTLGTPVIVLRDTTERQEGVDAGTVELVGTQVDAIVTAVARLLDDEAEYARRSSRANPYGDGHAAARIVQASEHIAFGTPAPMPYASGLERSLILRAAGYLEDPVDVRRELSMRRSSELMGEYSSAE